QGRSTFELLSQYRLTPPQLQAPDQGLGNQSASKSSPVNNAHRGCFSRLRTEGPPTPSVRIATGGQVGRGDGANDRHESPQPDRRGVTRCLTVVSRRETDP